MKISLLAIQAQVSCTPPARTTSAERAFAATFRGTQTLEQNLPRLLAAASNIQQAAHPTRDSCSQ